MYKCRECKNELSIITSTNGVCLSCHNKKEEEERLERSKFPTTKNNFYVADSVEEGEKHIIPFGWGHETLHLSKEEIQLILDGKTLS